MTKKKAIHWFRQDLRLLDNPALTNATKHGHVLPIYIIDDANAGKYAMGNVSKWWLNYSLLSLNQSVDFNLSFYRGNPLEIFDDILMRFDIGAVFWNRCYEPWQINRDTKIKRYLKSKGIDVHTSNGSLLWEPWLIQKKDKSPYKVFTHFYRECCSQAKSPRAPLTKPEKIKYLFDKEGSVCIDSLELLPKIRWDKKFQVHWQIGEKAAHERFKKFISEGLNFYKDGRNIPSKPFVSRLSPYLHFGEISPNQLWYFIRSIGDNKNIDHFCSQLVWREFSYSQLYYNPGLPIKNLQEKFDKFPWVENVQYLNAWKKGQTGVPMIDAGMRELWHTGYMHNRVRMIVGSFLVKNLRIHWHHGERWFWNTLADANLANNSASWQWITGCGADAAPYFRIFNPVTQGKKFDPDGSYIRRFIPEIAKLPNNYIFNPWEAPEAILDGASITLGKTYPKPIVDLKQSRLVALEAFQSLKKEVHE